MDSGAARYYYKISLLFLSSVDIHDLTSFFPDRIGMTEDEVKELRHLLKMLYEKTKEMAETHHLEEHWRKGAQELYERL